MGVIKLLVKSAVVAYPVHYTVKNGAWGSSDEAIEFKKNCCKAINENEFYQTGKSHFLTYVPVPEVSISTVLFLHKLDIL